MYLLTTYYVPDIVLGNGKHVLCHTARILMAVGTSQEHCSLSAITPPIHMVS